MRPLPTLHRELITAFALVFAGALLVAVSGLMVLWPALDSPGRAALYVAVLVVVDVCVFAVFGHYLVRRRLLGPFERMIAHAEAIAEGSYDRRLPPGETAEMARLAAAVNEMAERLIRHRERLAANIQSLEDTNRQLTEARDELIRAEKLSSVGRLAAGIAHEIGNPLGAIMGYLGVLKRGNADERGELVASAETEARRIDRIVRGLLDYARPREAKAQPLDVGAVVEQTLDLLEVQGRLRGIDVTSDLGSDLPAVVADPYQLQQVVVNLLLNAADAVEEEDAPMLSAQTRVARYQSRPQAPPRRKDDPPDVDYSHRRRFHKKPRVPRDDPFPAGEEVVEIAIADNGPGIPAELREEVFEPFVTTKEPGKGTGLGLAVAARLIDGMGGTIRAEHRAGAGVTFTILLPARPDERAEPGAPATAAMEEQWSDAEGSTSESADRTRNMRET